MKRSVWKWVFGISITVFILLVLFTLVMLALINVLGVTASSFYPDDFAYQEVTLWHLFSGGFINFISSPVGCAYFLDVTALIISCIMLIVTRKRKI